MQKSRAILWINEKDNNQQDLLELSECYNRESYFANEIVGITEVLDHKNVRTVFINVKKLADISTLNFISSNYNDLRIILKVNPDMEHVLSILKQTPYEMMHDTQSIKDYAYIL